LIHPTWPTFLKLENHQSNLECRKNIFAALLVSVCSSDGELAAFFAKGKIILKEQIFEKVGLRKVHFGLLRNMMDAFQPSVWNMLG
jgi:hypothetical protein